MKTRKAEHDLARNGAAIDIWENEGGASGQKPFRSGFAPDSVRVERFGPPSAQSPGHGANAVSPQRCLC